MSIKCVSSCSDWVRRTTYSTVSIVYFSHYLTSQDIEPVSLHCDKEDTWQHGNSLINYMKLVNVNLNYMKLVNALLNYMKLVNINLNYMKLVNIILN